MSSPGPNYRPLLLLGRGGMGSVEAAAEELADGTTRVVALKRILRAGGNDAPRVEMFLREARLTTLLEHPNVIRSLAYGETDGELFLAMEYVAGEPLSRLLSAAAERDARVPLPVLAYILAEASEGLHAAHELRGPDGALLGVVHRDVSPQNVMVGYDGTVKLLDFGVAKIDLLDCAARTKTGEVKGKTAYMSPEQAMGDPIDRRSDLYSMGAVLFEGVTGRRMWGAGTDLDVLRKLALEEPPRLVDAAPDAPPALAALFARLVERDRAKRPDTAHELALALRALATSEGADAALAPAATVDARSVQATMTRLFEGEKQRRETALARALASEGPLAPASSPTGAGPAGSRGPGESGPVFITQRGLATAPAGRRRGGVSGVTGAVTAAVVLTAALSFALYARAPHASREPADEPQRGAADKGGATDAHVTVRASPPSSAANAGLDAAVTVAPSRGAEPGSSLALQTHRPTTVLRRLATHPLASIPALKPGAQATPAASGPPAPSAARPAPPDVDPTPF